ncbi:MAG: hypothetical protein Q4C56_00575 [Peptococcaceae bacterium]|nr:hypothetical protein [Peptococcaceae bacterium]
MKSTKIHAMVIVVVSLLLCAGVYSATAVAQKAQEQEEKTIISETSATLVKYDYEALLMDAPVIVEARTIDASEPFQIQPVGGDENARSNFVDYTIEVEDVFRGNMSSGDTLDVRIEGGKVGNLDVRFHEAPTLHMGQSCLLFLYQPKMGAGYNTEGDYYYVLGLEQGAFHPVENGDKTVQGYQNDLGNVIKLETLTKDITELSKQKNVSVGNENRVYEEFLANQKANLESGYISKEEYDRLLSDAREYATIVQKN